MQHCKVLGVLCACGVIDWIWDLWIMMLSLCVVISMGCDIVGGYVVRPIIR